MGNLKIEYVRELGATKKTILKCQSLRCPKKKVLEKKNVLFSVSYKKKGEKGIN